MSKFKHLSIGSLPRVFVNVLAIYADEPEACADFVAQLVKETDVMTVLASFFGPRHVEFKEPTDANLPKIFAAVLSVPKDERKKFIRPFDRFLDHLGQQDAWGTEGQCDPRGDRRDDL